MEVDAAGGAGSAPSGDASGGSSKAAATAAAGSHGIDEAALYDRQLRVWGHEAQRRMRDSRVLVAGVTATLAEMAKNLVLGGIPVTLQDVVDVAAEDVGANILLAATDAGSNELNGFLEVDAVTTPLLELADDAWSRFSVVVASAAQLAPEEQFALDERCRAKGVGLYIVDTFGLHATFFVDLQEHTWIEADEHMRPTKKAGEFIATTTSYPSLRDAASSAWGHLPRGRGVKETLFAQQALFRFRATHGRAATAADAAEVVEAARALSAERGAKSHAWAEGPQLRAMCGAAGVEVAPVAAVLGGVLGQQVVKAVTGRTLPVCNMFAFDGTTLRGSSFALGVGSKE